MKTVPCEPPTKSLFVSRFAPDVSVSDVQEIVSSVLRGKRAIIRQLKTRFNTYSSFHMTADSTVFWQDWQRWGTACWLYLLAVLSPSWWVMHSQHTERWWRQCSARWTTNSLMVCISTPLHSTSWTFEQWSCGWYAQRWQLKMAQTHNRVFEVPFLPTEVPNRIWHFKTFVTVRTKC